MVLFRVFKTNCKIIERDMQIAETVCQSFYALSEFYEIKANMSKISSHGTRILLTYT